MAASCDHTQSACISIIVYYNYCIKTLIYGEENALCEIHLSIVIVLNQLLNFRFKSYPIITFIILTISEIDPDTHDVKSYQRPSLYCYCVNDYS